MTLTKPNINKLAFFIFPHYKERVEKGLCSICGQEIKEEEFTDNLSKQEYSISGMCQKCQYKTFNRR